MNDKILTARRENGPHHNLEIAKTYGGKWVVRDEEKNVIDYDQYRNDLKERYPGLIVIGD